MHFKFWQHEIFTRKITISLQTICNIFFVIQKILLMETRNIGVGIILNIILFYAWLNFQNKIKKCW